MSNNLTEKRARKDKDAAYEKQIEEGTEIILKQKEQWAKLKNQDVPENRRWIWELIQNTKDSYNNQPIEVCINYINDSTVCKFIYQHNGELFSREQLNSIICGKSYGKTAKDRFKNKDSEQKITGKYGTGFLLLILFLKLYIYKVRM